MLSQFLSATVQQTDVWVSTLHHFTIQLKHNTPVTTNADFFLDNGVQKFVRTDGGSFVADGFTEDLADGLGADFTPGLLAD